MQDGSAYYEASQVPGEGSFGDHPHDQLRVRSNRSPAQPPWSPLPNNISNRNIARLETHLTSAKSIRTPRLIATNDDQRLERSQLESPQLEGKMPQVEVPAAEDDAHFFVFRSDAS
jgi:hypothetical protein